MDKRTVIYLRLIGTSDELSSNLGRVVTDHGDFVAATFVDDRLIEGKGKNAGWRRLLVDLDQIDQIVLNDPGDLPGRTVKDLLDILATLTAHDVSVLVPYHGIDTRSGSPGVLGLISAYRRAKLSQAIRNGQAKALAAGKRIGRPTVPSRVRDRIQAALTEGGGIRSTARRYNVSPASVINVRRTMMAAQCTS